MRVAFQVNGLTAGQFGLDCARVDNVVAPTQLDPNNTFSSTDIVWNATSKKFELAAGATGLDAGDFYTSQFAWDPGISKMKISGLEADLIKVGRLQVGGGAGQISQLKIFNSDGSVLIGYDGETLGTGVPGSYYGSWRKILFVGGANPTLWKFCVDSSGNAFINDATFNLQRTESGGANYIAAINSAWIIPSLPTISFTGFTVYRTDATAHRALLINRGLVVQNPLGYTVASVTSYNSDPAGGNNGSFYGIITVNDAAGANPCTIDGSSGYIGASRGFKVNSKANAGNVWNWYLGFTGMIGIPSPAFVWTYNPNLYGTGGYEATTTGAWVYVYVDGGLITEARGSLR